MWSRLNNWLMHRGARARKSPAIQPRRLSFQPLESRELMAGIPALSSLPGAPHTLYLDFDGDVQAVWNRTDSNQHYTNVTAGEFNIDNTAGISDSETAAIRKIWETAADDYAPFNINVTTVAPSSFANGVAERVVMAGDCSATLQTGLHSTINVSGDRFIADNTGALVDTSGYSSIGSFNDAEPNVVYVFAKYMSTWDTVDSEGHGRDLRAMIATTASHEAGHGFGLMHDGDYNVGSAITTPIMGSNTQGDRTIWSSYQVGSVTHDNLAELTQVLGARADDFAGSYRSATNFQFSAYSPIFGWHGNIHGVISTGSDVDMFKLTVNSADTYNFNVSVPQFGDLDSQLVLYRVRQIPLFGYYYQTIASADPSISSIQPFQGLGASFSASLQPGTYAIAVRSHGGYGDLGNYTLNVNHGSIIVATDPVLTMASIAGMAQSSSNQPSSLTTVAPVSSTTKQPRVGAGLGASLPLATSLTEKSTSTGASADLNLYTQAVDSIFEAWATEGHKLQRHLV